MLVALIDPQGRVFPPDSPEVQEQFGTHLSGNVLSSFLSQNMGWIRLTCDSNAATVVCRPGRITVHAIAAIAYFLADRNISRATLPSYNRPPHRQCVTGLPDIITALERLAQHKSADPIEGRYLRRSVTASAAPSFHRVSEQLRQSGILTSPLDEVIKTCDEALGGRFTLATASDPERPVRIVAIGTSYTHFRPSYYNRAIGLGFEDSPDIHYGRWIAGTMREALISLQGAYGEVDADVRVFGKGDVRIRYDRMILPYIGSDGRRYVLSASQMRDSIDLRQEAG